MKNVKKSLLVKFTRSMLNISWYLLIVGGFILLVFSFFGKGILAQTMLSNYPLAGEGFTVFFKNSMNEKIIDPLFITFVLGGFIRLFITLYIIYNLKHIFNDYLEKMEIFTLTNVKRIRLIGILIIISTISKSIITTYLGYIISKYLTLPENIYLEFNFSFDTYMIFMGIVVIILSGVFHLGYNLLQDQEYTV